MSRRLYNLDDPADVAEVVSLLTNDSDPIWSEDLGEESDIASEDEVEERIEDSETEQEGETNEDNKVGETNEDNKVGETDEDNDDDESTSFFWGKDKITKWNQNPPRSNKRKGSHNVIIRLPGVKGDAKAAKTAVDSWNCLFTEEILDIIVRYTNQYIEIIRGKFTRDRDIKLTDIIEIKAFFGLLYLSGAFRGNRQSIEELWGNDGDGIEKFRLVMSIKRFKVLIRCLRFDDRTTREERKKTDRLAPVRDIFQKFVHNCQKSYYPGINLTVDEMLPGFRGNCPFRQYIPSKPNKYGIKLFSLVDSKMYYTYNMEIYAGKQPEGPFFISNKASEVVKRMAEPFYGSGRNITADNWFTDMDLVDVLRKNKLSYVGTVRKNKRHLPPKFVATKGRAQYSSLFGFNDGKTLVSYIPKRNKNVILVSTLHEDTTIDPDSQEKMKPEIITFYNGTKGGVDIVDQMCSTFNVARNIRRWPMIIFFTMLNVAGINSQVIYHSNNLQPLHRRIFLKRLAHELTIAELNRRCLKTVGMPRELQHMLSKFRCPTPKDKEILPESPKRMRCSTCSTENSFRRMSNY